MLSETALDLLRSCVDAGKPRVDASNIEAYRELARAGVMYPVSTFARGPEAIFRFTERGWNRRRDFLAQTVESL